MTVIVIFDRYGELFINIVYTKMYLERKKMFLLSILIVPCLYICDQCQRLNVDIGKFILALLSSFEFLILLVILMPSQSKPE